MASGTCTSHKSAVAGAREEKAMVLDLQNRPANGKTAARRNIRLKGKVQYDLAWKRKRIRGITRI